MRNDWEGWKGSKSNARKAHSGGALFGFKQRPVGGPRAAALHGLHWTFKVIGDMAQGIWELNCSPGDITAGTQPKLRAKTYTPVFTSPNWLRFIKAIFKREFYMKVIMLS